jgi:hypothetical protein
MQLSPVQDPTLYMLNKVAYIASVFDISIASSQQEKVLTDRSRHRYKRNMEGALVVSQACHAAKAADDDPFYTSILESMLWDATTLKRTVDVDFQPSLWEQGCISFYVF